MKSIEIQTKNGICDATVAVPPFEKTAQETLKKYPGVLVLMDAFGPRQNLFEMIQKLASNGFIVLLPNLFYLQKRAPIVTGLNFPLKAEDLPLARSQFLPLMKNFDLGFALEDIGAYLNFFKTQENFNGNIGVVGYCMGGSLGIRASAKYPELIQATASFHGGHLATDAADSPHLLLTQLKARLYVAHADNDASMPVEQIEKFKQSLATSGIQAQADLYAGAAHGFTMADLPAYNEAANKRHWTELLKHFSKL